MYIAEQGGLGQVQKVIIALNLTVIIGKPVATERCLVQFQVLDHGAHAAIKDDDAFFQGVAKLFQAVQASVVVGHINYFRKSFLSQWRAIIAKMAVVVPRPHDVDQWTD